MADTIQLQVAVDDDNRRAQLGVGTYVGAVNVVDAVVTIAEYVLFISLSFLYPQHTNLVVSLHKGLYSIRGMPTSTADFTH